MLAYIIIAATLTPTPQTPKPHLKPQHVAENTFIIPQDQLPPNLQITNGSFIHTKWPDDHPFAELSYNQFYCPHNYIYHWDTMEIPMLPYDTLCTTDKTEQVYCTQYIPTIEPDHYNEPSIRTHMTLPPAQPIIIRGPITCIIIFSNIKNQRYTTTNKTIPNQPFTSRTPHYITPFPYPNNWHKKLK